MKSLSAVALLAFAAPAAAQLSNHAIALETGISRPFEEGASARPVVALAASTWLDGQAEAVARLELGSAPRTAGRPQARRVAGTLGLRISLLPDPVRPQIGVEVGWARMEGPDFAEDGLVIGFGVGLEWFPGRDLSVAARASLRRTGDSASADLVAGLAAYF